MPGKKHGKLPKHIQQSPRKSQKRYIIWTTGSPKAKAKLLKKSKKRSRKRSKKR